MISPGTQLPPVVLDDSDRTIYYDVDLDISVVWDKKKLSAVSWKGRLDAYLKGRAKSYTARTARLAYFKAVNKLDV